MKTVSLLAVALSLSMAAGVAQAGVRVIHASPNTPGVDIYVNQVPNGSPAIPNLLFTQGTGYVPLATGNYNFAVTLTGSTDVALGVNNVPIDGNVDYTVAAIGFTANIAPLLLVDNNVAPAAGNARIRFVHAAPDVPAVDIAINNLGNPGGVLFNDSTFGSAASEGYIEVPAGTYDLGVFLSANNALALPVSGVQLAAGQVYSVFAMGSISQGNVQAVIFSDPIPAPGAAGLLMAFGAFASRRRR